MQIIQSDDFQIEKDSVICIGKFESLHLGHQSLIQKAKLQDKQVILLTFEMKHDEILFLFDEKVRIAERLGIDVIISYPFTEALRTMSPHDFLKTVVQKKCHASSVIVGSDFHFGYQRKGNVSLLKEFGEENNLSVTIMNAVDLGKEPVSSSRIRQCIHEGNCEKAMQMLGFPYFFSGIVVKGNQIGRTLDMPTANLVVPNDKIIPPKGVYASITHWNGKRIKGVTNIGNKPTITGKHQTGVETYLFDFNEDIYGDFIQVDLYAYLRPEQKFSGLSELKENMWNDKENSKKALAHITE